MLSIVFSKAKRLLLINCKEDPQQIFSQKRLYRGKSPITPVFGKIGQGKNVQGNNGQGKIGQGKIGQGKIGHGKFGHGKFGHGKTGQGKTGQGKFIQNLQNLSK